MRKPVVGIPLGDPSGVGPEIALKAMANPQMASCCVPVLVGPRTAAEDAIRRFDLPLSLVFINRDQVPDRYESQDDGQVLLLETSSMERNALRFGVVCAASGAVAYEAIALSVREAAAGRFDALATTPINKEALRAADVEGIGHTEILGGMTGVADPLTLFQTMELRIFFLSRHVSLRQACDMVTAERVKRYGRECITAMRMLGFPTCRLAIAGLNPHSGEHGLFGDEEGKAIEPAVANLRAEGFEVVGPMPADSVFHQAAIGRYDAVLSLYHDQGHIAAKMHDFERTISLTIGLPFLRTSVDHGTAFDIAGKGIASPVSMEEAIKAAARYGMSYRDAMQQVTGLSGAMDESLLAGGDPA